MKHTEKTKMKKLLLAGAAAVLVTAAGTCAVYIAAESAAGDSVAVSEIDYDKLTLTVKANSDDNRVYFATSKTAATWEKIPGDLDNSQKITMDISWVSASKNTTLYLKGDKSDQPCEVVLPKQNTAFKATFNPADNTMKFVNQGEVTDTYWRKSTATTWKKYEENDESKALFESFCTKGITLYFRTGQKAGDDTSAGIRPSKTYTVKIAKRAAAPKVTLDYSKLAFTGVKKTMEYKPSASNDAWTPVDSTTLNLSEALPDATKKDNTGSSDEPETVSIDFRIKATTTKTASQVCTIKVPVQENTPNNVALVYTGSTQCKLTAEKTGEGEDAIAAASASNPYEYTIFKPLKPDDTLDIAKAKWTTMKTSSVILSSKTAPEGNVIYVRKKATKTALATAETKLTVGTYPSADLNSLNIEMKKIQGMELEKKPFSITALGTDTKVVSILCSGTPVEFTQTSIKDGTDKCTITITLTDVSRPELIESNLNKKNPLQITLDNGDNITEGVTLYIQKAATIEAAAYTKYIGIPFTSDNNGNICFDVALNSDEKADVTITSISYNGNTLKTKQTDSNDDEYTVGSITTDNKLPVTIYKKTIDEKLPSCLTKSNYGTPFSFLVTLSNKETLEQVTAKVAYPITVSANASSVGISISGYKKAVEQAAANNTAIADAYADPVITYTLDSEATKGNSYEIKSLTWNGQDVLGSYTGSGSSWKVTLSLAKLTELPPANAELTLTLVNTDKGNKELAINYGYYITLIQ